MVIAGVASPLYPPVGISRKESFMNNLEWLSQGKLRAAWGEIGNQTISSGAYMNTFEMVATTSSVIRIRRTCMPDVRRWVIRI